MELGQISQVFGLLAVLVAVIFAAYYLTKYVAAKASGSTGRARYFKVIDRFSISKEKMFILIAVGQIVYLVGITNQGMTLIDQKDISDLPPEDKQTGKPLYCLSNFLSGMKNDRRTFNGNANENSKSFSDLIKQVRQKEDNHEN